MTDRPPRLILVTPQSCIGPGSGGGQRTSLFFAALSRLGPVEVVVLGHAPDLARAAPHFPGAAALHALRTDRALTGRPGRMARLWQRVERFGLIRLGYRADPAVRAGMQRILAAADRPALVVYRYFRPFCLAGHVPGPDGRDGRALLAVDVDDRDDQKLELTFAEAAGRPGLARLYARALMPGLRRLMVRRLAPLARVWFAAAEDLAGFEGPAAAVAPNVPWGSAVPADLPPPSAGRDLVFVGTFALNVAGVRWFLRQCWPALHARHPGARLRLVGRGGWERLADEGLPLEGVDLVGGVETLEAEYGRARAVIAPVFAGAGSKVKVIEACAWGRPVVTTRHSSRGFGEGLGPLLPVADEPAAFAELCSRYLADPAAADALGARLQQVQQALYSREAVERRIAAQAAEVLGRAGGTA